MADISDLAKLGASEDSPTAINLVRAIVHSIDGSLLKVIVPSFDEQRIYEIENDLSRAGSGDEVLVAFDDDDQPWLAVPAWPFRYGGLLIGVSPGYVSPFAFEGDAVVGDYFGFGPSPGSKATGPGGSGILARSGPAYIDRISMRLGAQTALTAHGIGDNPQLRGLQGPGWGHAYPTPGINVILRHPPGQTTWVSSPAAADAEQIFVFPVKSWPGDYDGTIANLECIVAGQAITYTNKLSRNAKLSGDLPAGAASTECTIAENQPEGFPDEGGWRIRSQQIRHTGRVQALAGTVKGLHKAGATAIEVENVIQSEWDDIPHGAGAVRIELLPNDSKAFEYDSATYDAPSETATFVLNADDKLNANAADGAAVTMHKLTGLTSDFVHFVEGDHEAGSETITLGLVADDGTGTVRPLGLVMPYSLDPVGQADIDRIPSSSFCRVSTYDDNPAGPGGEDYPTMRLAYDDREVVSRGLDEQGREVFTVVLTLAEPLPAKILSNLLIEIEGCPGIFRDRTSGMQLTMHVLDGVEGLTEGAGVGEVGEFSPRYGQPTSPSIHIAMDHWAGPSGRAGYMSMIGGNRITDAAQNPGSRWTHIVRVPESGLKIQKFMVAPMGLAVLGSGARGHGDIRHNLHVGDWYTRVKPPNITLEIPDEDDPVEDPDPEDPDEGEDPDEEEPGSGEIASATINVGWVIGHPTMPTRIKVSCHNRETGTIEIGILAVTDASETGGAEGNPVLTGVTYPQDQAGQTTLQGAHDLATLTELDVASVADFATPSPSCAGKWRAVDPADGETVLARGTNTSRDTTAATKLTGVVVTSGSGILPDGTLIEEDYAIGDMWLRSGVEISPADDVQTAAAGSATDFEWGTDRANGGRVGVTGPLGEHGIQTGPRVAGALTDPLRLYRGSDGKWKVKYAAGAEETVATEEYADLLAQGFNFKDTVLAATTANISLQNLQTIDGVSLAAGDRVLVKDQTDQAENGIYECKAGTAWVRTLDANVGSELESAVVAVALGGTENANTTWRQLTDPVTLGTSNIVWTEMASINEAGTGSTRTGNRLDVNAQAPIVANTDDLTMTAAPPPPVDRQVFTASGTWTKPTTPSGFAAYTEVAIEMIGGGGGGGSARRGAAGTARAGGGGGAGGSYSRRVIPIASCAATEPVTVGAAGSGGPAVSADNTNGAPGTNGSASQFGTGGTESDTRAAGGANGVGGASGSGGAGGSGNASRSQIVGQSGGLGGASPTNSPSAPTNAVGYARGGGGGGGITTADVVQDGAAGGNQNINNASSGAAGTAGGAGGNGSTHTPNGIASGGGGGGGGASIVAAAGAGGNGGAYGSGGGGGGASLNGNNSGAGGNGAAGIVVVTTR